MIVVDVLLWVMLVAGTIVGVLGMFVSFCSYDDSPLFLIATPLAVVCLLLIKLVML